MGKVLAGEILVNARHHPAPATGFDHAQDGYQQSAEPDQKKLQHFVEDCGKQSAA